ncbi:MAG: hypothetical protein RL495_590 [Verrucomicrobiota bacterium]|jgi:tetratricopeptide (TPR) repeat protein
MRIAILTALAIWLTPSAQAIFAEYETDLVPIERVFAGLKTKLAATPDDFELHYQIARLHAMAAFKDNATVPVIKDNGRSNRAGRVLHGSMESDNGTPEIPRGRRDAPPSVGATGKDAATHLADATKHFDLALSLLRKAPNAKENTWLIKPLLLGSAWCLDKAGRREEALSAYRQALAISWHMEVIKDFKPEDWLKGTRYELTESVDPAATKRGFRAGFLRGGVCFSEECISYLLNLLDPQKDAEEIRILKLSKERLERMPRAVTPILIPLSETPFDTLVDVDAQVAFDLDGSGLRRHWGWITPKAAWLVFDGKETGRINSGLQMFGSVTFWIFWRDGYQALGSLDTNGDGLLNGAELRGLALWLDANSNGISEPGEVKPLSAYSIDQLSCRGQTTAPGLRLSPQGVRFKDGSFRPTYDWDSPMNAPAAAK